MGAYLDTLLKIAYEEVIPANEGSLADSEMWRRLRNAGIIGAGVALGTAAGTGLASYLTPRIPDAVKGAWLPTGLGLSAGLLSWIKSERDRQRDRDLQGDAQNRVLLRVPPDEAGRIRSVLQQIRPQKTPISVSMTSDSGPNDVRFGREIVIPSGVTERDLGESIWGTKQAADATDVALGGAALGGGLAAGTGYMRRTKDPNYTIHTREGTA